MFFFRGVFNCYVPVEDYEVDWDGNRGTGVPGGYAKRASLWDDYGARMRTRKGACVAFDGKVGDQCGCRIYARRSIACRTFPSGGEYCKRIRKHYGLPV